MKGIGKSVLIPYRPNQPTDFYLRTANLLSKLGEHIMPQNPEKIKDHVELFHNPEYQELFEGKKKFEGGHDPEEVKKVAEWTKSWEYREKNFQREALTVNPAKGCQPLGAIYAAAGFEGTLPFVQGIKSIIFKYL